MPSKKTEIKTPEEDQQVRPGELVGTLIQKKSEAGELAFPKDIVQILTEHSVPLPDQESEYEKAFSVVIREAKEENPDLTEIAGHDGLPRYYSRIYMSDPYAGLLVRKEGNPALLIADTVRENSKIYPRPIPRDTFKNSPFELTEDEISACLEKMKEDDEYRDIAQTTTSADTVFLYSTLHLEPDHASMLAEWIDVGQHRNP